MRSNIRFPIFEQRCSQRGLQAGVVRGAAMHTAHAVLLSESMVILAPSALFDDRIPSTQWQVLQHAPAAIASSLWPVAPQRGVRPGMPSSLMFASPVPCAQQQPDAVFRASAVIHDSSIGQTGGRTLPRGAHRGDGDLLRQLELRPCDRRSRSSCAARTVPLGYMLAHNSMMLAFATR